MKTPILILLLLVILIPCRPQAANWTNYPFVTTPAATDTFLVGTTTTNKQYAFSNLTALIITTSNGVVSVITTSTNGLASTNFVLTTVNTASNSLAAQIAQKQTTNAALDKLAINNAVSLTNVQTAALVGTLTNVARLPLLTTPQLQLYPASQMTNFTVTAGTGNAFYILATNNVYFTEPTGLTNGWQGIIHFVQDATGGRTCRFATNWWKFPSGQVLTLTTNANAWSVISLVAGPTGTNMAVVQSLNFQ